MSQIKPKDGLPPNEKRQVDRDPEKDDEIKKEKEKDRQK